MEEWNSGAFSSWKQCFQEFGDELSDKYDKVLVGDTIGLG